MANNRSGRDYTSPHPLPPPPRPARQPLPRPVSYAVGDDIRNANGPYLQQSDANRHDVAASMGADFASRQLSLQNPLGSMRGPRPPRRPGYANTYSTSDLPSSPSRENEQQTSLAQSRSTAYNPLQYGPSSPLHPKSQTPQSTYVSGTAAFRPPAPPPRQSNPAAYHEASIARTAPTAHQIHGHVPNPQSSSGHARNWSSTTDESSLAEPFHSPGGSEKGPYFRPRRCSVDAPLPLPPAPHGHFPLTSTPQSFHVYPSMPSPDSAPALEIKPTTPSRLQSNSRIFPRYGSADDLSAGSPTYTTIDSVPTTPTMQRLQGTLSRSNTSGRHPHSRPLPGPPPEPSSDSECSLSEEGYTPTAEELAQDDLFAQVESAVMGSGGRASRDGQNSDSSRSGRSRQNSDAPLTPLHSSATRQGTYSSVYGSGYSAGSHTQTAAGHQQRNSDGSAPELRQHDQYSDTSDAEAAAGLAAMRLADEQEAYDARRGISSSGSGLFSNGIMISRPSRTDLSRGVDGGSDDYYGNVDMGGYEGGYDLHMSYGGTPEELAAGHNEIVGANGHRRTLSSRDIAARSSEDQPYGTFSQATSVSSSRPLSFAAQARVDESGTGGLAEPSSIARRKLSFDEGDESGYLDDPYMSEGGPFDVVEPFYAPPPTSRPLPPPPPFLSRASSMLAPDTSHKRTSYGDASSLSPYPVGPHAYLQPNSTPPGMGTRSVSLVSHSSTPHILLPPLRSKTDAEERKKQSQFRVSVHGTDGDQDLSQARNPMSIDLPTLPIGKRFQPSKLTARDFDRCGEPWAVSKLAAWFRQLAESENELKKQAILDAFLELFTYKFSNMSIADAESLASRVFDDMVVAGALVQEEEWFRFAQGKASGVLFQLTGRGCYSPVLHVHDMTGRCYSYHCQRTVKKFNLKVQGERSTGDWATFHKLKKEDVEGVDRKEIERQNILHEIIQTEDQYMEQLDVLSVLYYNGLTSAKPPIIAPKRLDSFLNEILGKLDAVRSANQDHLLPQLKYRQQEQGPWIKGFSDIFRDWIRRAKTAYIEYAANFPNANFLVRQEDARNMLFKAFLEGARNNKMSKKLGWDTYLKAPITRLQRYGLLLSTVHKSMTQASEEKASLQTAIDEIKAVTVECDTKVAEMGRKVDLSDLAVKLVLRPEMKSVELNLTHWGRELLFKGDLQRTSSSRFTWLETHAMLFDNYLVLAKTQFHRDAEGNKYERYDVSKMPIPMELLILETTEENPVVKSSVKGLASVSTISTPVPPSPDSRVNRTGGSTTQSGGLGTLTQSATSTSLSTLSIATNSTLMTAVSNMTSSSTDNGEKIMYPFKVKHLGQEVYTLFAPSAQNRREWCEKIIEAKTKHAASLRVQHAEPFRLSVVADAAFAYDAAHAHGPMGVTIKGTPLHRAIRDVQRRFPDAAAQQQPICRARVNCATVFLQPPGTRLVAIGTDYGVYVSEQGSPRGWRKAISVLRVTQIAVLEEFNTILVIADKALLAYHLDVAIPPAGAPVPALAASPRRAPQKLSGARDVGFFATGRLKDRQLVLYKKRDGVGSAFRTLEPVLARGSASSATAATDPRRPAAAAAAGPSALHRGRVGSWRAYDEFVSRDDAHAAGLFRASVAVATARGFEVRGLDKKTAWAVPDLSAPHVTSIAARLAGAEALALLKLGDGEGDGDDGGRSGGGSGGGKGGEAAGGGGGEFLAVYADCAVYVNRHGDVSRGVVMEFVHRRARAAALAGGFLVLVGSDFVEVRDAVNGRLKQVIAGRDCRMLWGGGGSGKTREGSGVLVAMCHPEMERGLLVLEMVREEERETHLG